MRILKTILFSLTPALLLLVAAEVAIRVTGAARTCPQLKGSSIWVCDPIFYFRPRPDLVIPDGVKVNSEGFRGPEFGSRRAPLRILALGDSCTFGMIHPSPGVGFFIPEPYPNRLERLAAERLGPGRVEVLNGGVSGYTTYQGIMLLRTRFRSLHPDILTVRLGWNDLLASAAGTMPNALREPATTLGRGIEDLLLRTALYPFARRLRMELAFRVSGDTTRPPQGTRDTWIPDIPPEQYEANLRRIVELGQSLGADVWLLTSPDAFMVDEYRDKHADFEKSAAIQFGMIRMSGIRSLRELTVIHYRYNELVREVGRTAGVTVVDMAKAYREHGSEHLFTPVDVIHPNQEGHALEAETLYRELEQRGLLAGTDGRGSGGTTPGPIATRSVSDEAGMGHSH